MDLTQSKLTRSEWETIEVPVSQNEKLILKMIVAGYDNVNIRTNDHQSLYSFLKIDRSPETERLLFTKYFEEPITKTITKYGQDTPLAKMTIQPAGGGELKHMKSLDKFRIQNLDSTLGDNKSLVFEFLLLDLASELLKQIFKSKQKYAFYLYTIMQLKKTSISNLNCHLMRIIDSIVAYANSFTKTSEIITNAYEFIERNTFLFKYEDRALFAHQKQLFSICKPPAPDCPFVPKLVLYTAPTGTGKTLSPIGLSEKYRIIFVCVARHIGLALAKSAISVEKKVAFAFGCDSAADIRLHYFAAIDYTRNRRSGGIGKVDNSVGDNVEIMICDVQSYITAMHYMLAFNPAERIITYWDEPTITMDYKEHALHSVIHKNWTDNQIPTVILSCATLPTEDELQPVFSDFRCKFEDAEIHTITSYDCRKSIPILDKSGYCVLPHFMYSDFAQLHSCIRHCDQNKTLLRYFDLREIIRFVKYVNSENLIDDAYTIDSYFTDDISNITMNRLKEYYLDVLLHINPDHWEKIYKYATSTRKPKYADAKGAITKTTSVEQTARSGGGGALARTNSVFVSPPAAKTASSASSGISLTTSDAYTLTDGPTIFLAEDVNKIGNFYIQQTNIAESAFQTILAKIARNTEVVERIDRLESDILAKETKTGGDGKDDKTAARESGRLCKESQAWMNEINKLRKELRAVGLDPMYVPNSRPHQAIWTPDGEVHENAFVSNIDEITVKNIMQLNISNNYKVLLLLGIGVFTENPNIQYMEIIKKLADEQRLFIIIASSDYIYGTNYQFCHGFIGKDLTNMTQQKTLQAMGRIGRNNIQQDYTIRFRTDEMIMNLFTKSAVNLEADNMCALFSTP